MAHHVAHGLEIDRLSDEKSQRADLGNILKASTCFYSRSLGQLVSFGESFAHISQHAYLVTNLWCDVGDVLLLREWHY